jgi:hypothetical protein
MTAFANQIHEGPVVFAPLEQVKGQFGEFPTTQSTTQQNSEKCSIAFAFQRFDSGRLPETASFLGGKPIPEPNSEFLGALHPLDARGKFRAQ